MFLARHFIAAFESAPRVAAFFATQQRWLLCHAALTDYFQVGPTGPTGAPGAPGMTRRALVQRALRHGIASLNTTHALFDEALKYGVIAPAGPPVRGRIDAVTPTPEALSLLIGWYAGHLHALDLIDGGDRQARFLAFPEDVLAVVQPSMTLALLTSPEVRAPGPLYTIFTWVDAGGLLMDRLVAGIDPDGPRDRDRMLTDVNAISHLAQAFGLSRAHASRKLSAAERIGGIGWTGRRGRSQIWISRGFYEEYALAQARKLAVLGAALAGASASA